MNIGAKAYPNTISVHVIPMNCIVELEAGRIKDIYTRFRSMIAPVAGKLGMHGSYSDQSHYDDERGTLELCDKDVFAIISYYRMQFPHLSVRQFRLSTALLFGMNRYDFNVAWKQSFQRIPDRYEPSGKRRIAGRSLAELHGEDEMVMVRIQ
jgi:hypothetical protein